MVKRIKTYLKFQKSERDNVTFVSYIRKENGSWKGCRESDGCKKKVVLVDTEIAATMMENILYDVILVPMKEDTGFIAISAKPVKFTARIETFITDERYAVEVRFGYKVITYDPQSPMENRRSIDGVAETLLKRIDIKAPERVVLEFRESAATVLAYFKADHPNYL